MGTNYDKLRTEIGSNHNPFIAYDIETTGIMNGNDNRITQMSLVAYAYNKDNGKYELQDQLFMLAKPDEQVIRTLQEVDKARIANPEQTVKDKLIDDYIYSLVKKEPDEEKQQAIRDKRSLYEDYCVVAMDINGLGLARLSDEDFAIPNKPSSDTLSADDRSVCEGFVRFCNTYGRLQKKIDDVTHEMTIEQILAKQGLDLEKYIADGKGLTPAEMQVGITEFLNKYHAPNTVFVNNGTHFTKHYMEKENLSFLGYTDDTDKVIDLIQVQRSMRGGNVHFTADVGTFAENYKKETGKEIKTFDALTKGLCLGEITVKACDMSVSLTSETYLVNKVAESAMSKDNDYVMSNARASAMNWLPASQHAFDIADFHFNSLEYVDFGNDRRYVDIDKMFEMNDNFEITLEGEKEPIKTWEELETKIKALNSEISDELLDKIHEKYEEITQRAEEERKDDLMNRYEMESLDISALSKEDFEFLDREYDLQHNSWAMAERHKDIKEAFIKAVEKGDYELFDIVYNNGTGLQVWGLSDEYGKKNNHGIVEIVDGKIPMEASIDVYDGINTKPVYSMDITFDELDRLNNALQAQREQEINKKIDDFIDRNLAKSNADFFTAIKEGKLGETITFTPSTQLGKALLEYYGANIDSIVITHKGNNATAVLSGIITNEDTLYTDTFSKNFDLSKKVQRAVCDLYSYKEYTEISKEVVGSKEWKADVEKRYKEGSLSVKDMTKEQYEYLDDMYELSFNLNVKDKLYAFLSDELRKPEYYLDVEEETLTNDNLGVIIDVSLSEPLKKLVEENVGYYDSILVSYHKENGFAFVLQGMEGIKDIEWTKSHEEIVTDMIDRKIHGELEPVISEQEKAEALIEQLQAIRKENKDLSKEMSELETKGKAVFQELSNLAYTLVPAIQEIREKVGVDIMNNMSTTSEALTARDVLHTVPNASVSIPMGRVDVELTLYNTDKDKSEQSVKFAVVDRYGTSYDENSTGAMKCLTENDITKDNIVSQFWCNVAHNVQTVIEEESKATDKLREDVKEMKDTMLSFTKSDVNVDKKNIQKGQVAKQ